MPQSDAPPKTPATGGKLPFIDGLRAFAAVTIVLHHLAFYGPLSDRAHQIAPGLVAFLFDYGRFAVQIFLVVGGFVTVRHLSRLPFLDGPAIGRELWARYRRIGLPYLAALALAIAANEVARLWMDDPSISNPPSLWQLIAHAGLLTHILGFEALTAGIWYLAIDFQITVLCVVLLALAQRLDRRDPLRAFRWVTGILGLLSLFWAGRIQSLDAWAPYFFASTWMGMLVEWVRRGVLGRWVLPATAGLVVVAEAVEFRPRLVVSLATAVVLYAAVAWPKIGSRPRSPAILFLGRISFSLFLVHFPVCLLINAIAIRFFDPSPLASLGWMALAVAASVAAAQAFAVGVEERLTSLGEPARRRTGSAQLNVPVSFDSH
jgi:peptidoglycan/LPS O-acetylase OafA/YrhL